MKFGKKLSAKIESPKFVGFFTEEEARQKGMRLIVGRQEGMVALYWLIDESDGVIADAKFQAYGPPALIGAAEIASGLVIRKNYDQARRIGADVIDRECEPFPKEAAAQINWVLSAIDAAAEQCTDIPFADTYVAPPMHLDLSESGEYPGWKELSKREKLAVIEDVVHREIRPYIELDAGGVKILDLIDEKEVLIAYQGTCTTCYSATGATLSAIEQILRAKIYPDLTVTPDLVNIH